MAVKIGIKYVRRSRLSYVIGAVLLVLVSVVLLALAISGKTRRNSLADVSTPSAQATSTGELVPRKLDGVLVPAGQEAFAPRAIMVENHVQARPLSGVAKANVVIEAPVEGGITRFLLLFDATTTVDEIGPVRSARPYYVDWADAWHAQYFHVGGSPDALMNIRALGSRFANIDEMAAGKYFWRSTDRSAPHNAYTSKELTDRAMQERGFVTSTAVMAWHFQDAASSTDRGTVSSIAIPYGGSYNVNWKYDQDRGVYVRSEAAQVQQDRDGTAVESENVIIIKTDAKVLDEVGRLKLRTTGGGDAVAYRDGKKFVLRWQRGIGESIKFEGADGSEFLLTRGRTWIEVTTDDRIFAGLGI